MWEAIIGWMTGEWPALVITTAVACYVTWYVTRFYERYKHIEKTVNDLPCREREKEISNLRRRVKSMQPRPEIKQAPSFSRKASPLRLNDVGERVFADCKGEEFILRHKELLFEWIDEEKPKTALDVEQCAMMVLMMYSDEDIFNGLKDWVYNSPAIKVEKEGKIEELIISLQDLFFIISLPLRDIYLQEHPKPTTNPLDL